MKHIQVRSQQRLYPVISREVRKATIILMDELLQTNAYDLNILFVNETRMAKINLEHLRHGRATDIITFDYTTSTLLHGDLIISPHVASENAARYRVSLGHEITRNIIHGVLHLLGHDDSESIVRKKMKRAENRLLQKLARRFPLDRLAHG